MTERSEAWVQAGLDLTDLERRIGGGLPSVSVQIGDQWAATLRDTFAGLDAALDGPEDCRTAFAGAYLAVAILIDNLPIPWDRMDKSACILRYLYDRGSEAAVDLDELSHLEFDLEGGE